VTDKHGQTVVVPKVGMTFESEKDTYEMYNTYAGQIGFSIRKSDTNRQVDKSIYSKLIVCTS
jgi:zinc finger SWIM domain-containing protein 3